MKDVIQAFIASYQNEPCQIHLSDVMPLKYLSYKYEYPKLISITEKFIQNPKELIEFLFKCLDEYGKDASVLFSFIDFENQSIGVVNKLIQNFSVIFDFSFINSTLLKTTTQLTSEVAKIKEEYSSFIIQMKKLQDENEDRRNRVFEEEMAKMKEEEEKRQNKLDEEMRKIKEKEEAVRKEEEERLKQLQNENVKRIPWDHEVFD
ncbi:hypothetical protein M9Y10_015599 [Tritrichomonas musculus]|uniref:Uncharacterized protein n=1 Tax=Tritrichomonas musculus TaxID=1915356 RepID=A0ABR2L3N4_9EUKA